MTKQIILTRATDANDEPLSGALAYIYQEGTTTDVTAYQEAALSTAHAQPIVADSDGRFAQAFTDGTTRLKVVYKTSGGTTFLTEDPAKETLYDGSAASEVSYDGSSSGLGATDVQAAVDEVSASVTNNTANAQTIVATGGSANAYTLVAASTITAYAAGQEFAIRINHANTGAATLNVDSLGAKSIMMYDGGGSLSALPSGALNIDDIRSVFYDGTRFIVRTNIISDNVKFFFGTNQDMEVFHTGVNGFIRNLTGDLIYRSDSLYLASVTGTENYIRCTLNGSVDLYWNDIVKLSTTSDGVDVAGGVLPDTDNTYDIGSASFRWQDVYATNGTIQTSDEREKQNIEELSASEKAAAAECARLIRSFRWRDDVSKYGDEAEIHFGVIAQDVMSTFSKYGLNPTDYGIIYQKEGQRLGVRYTELLAFIIGGL